MAAQVALSIALLVGAGLCLRSLNQAARLTPGFQADGVVVGWLDLFSAGYNAEQGRAFYARVIDRVRTARRGISVAEPPHSARFQRRQLHRRDRRRSSEIRRRSARRWIELRRAGLRGDAARFRLLAGRDLSADDRFEQPRVALITESMARVFWKDRDPIGGRFMFGGPRPDQEPQWILVVGVVKDIKQRTLTSGRSRS